MEVNKLVSQEKKTLKKPITQEELASLYFLKFHPNQSKQNHSEKLKDVIKEEGYGRVKRAARYILSVRDLNKLKLSDDIKGLKTTISQKDVLDFYNADEHLRSEFKRLIEPLELIFANSMMNVISLKILEIFPEGCYAIELFNTQPQFIFVNDSKRNEVLDIFKKIDDKNASFDMKASYIWNYSDLFSIGELRKIFTSLIPDLKIEVLKYIYGAKAKINLAIEYNEAMIKSFESSWRAINALRNKVNHAEQLFTADIQWNNDVIKEKNSKKLNQYECAFLQIKYLKKRSVTEVNNIIESSKKASNTLIRNDLKIINIKGERC